MRAGSGRGIAAQWLQRRVDAGRFPEQLLGGDAGLVMLEQQGQLDPEPPCWDGTPRGLASPSGW